MMDECVKVYYSAIPKGDVNYDIYPEERAREIDAIRNDRLKREKYFAWKLLELALIENGVDIKALDFAKNESGKWVCDKCYFSLSHTDGAVAVALSDSSVGVDIEVLSDRALKVAKKVFSAEELDAFCDDDILYTTKLWTMKESIFKTLDERVFSPQSISAFEHETKTRDVTVAGKKYVVSVAGKGAENAEFYEK